MRTKELWLGQVVRTGHRDFGFVQLRGPRGMGGVRFCVRDFAEIDRGRSVPATPRLGATVLVLLGDDTQHALRLWRIKVAADGGRNGEQVVRRGSNGRANKQGRRSGRITKLVGADCDFITEIGTGHELFVHSRELRGMARLMLG